MKQGKVFDKLKARKNVQDITFQDKTCTVTLLNGMSKVCGTAHEARLFIEGKEVAGATQTTPKAVADFEAAFAPATKTPREKTISRLAAEACGTGAESTVRITRDWWVGMTGSDDGFPAGHNVARITTDAMAVVLAANL